MTFLCKLILIQTNNCEYEVLNVKCHYCFYRKLPNKLVFFYFSVYFYDIFQTKLKKIVPYRGVSRTLLLNNVFRRGYLGFVFVHLAPPPQKKINYGYERSAKGLSTVMIVSKSS